MYYPEAKRSTLRRTKSERDDWEQPLNVEMETFSAGGEVRRRGLWSDGAWRLLAVHEPISCTTGRARPLDPQGGKCLFDSSCQHSLCFWYEQRTGRELIHCFSFAPCCIGGLTLVSSEFHPKEKLSNWAISQAQGDVIWEWQKNRIPFLLWASEVVLLHPFVVEGVWWAGGDFNSI